MNFAEPYFRSRTNSRGASLRTRWENNIKTRNRESSKAGFSKLRSILAFLFRNLQPEKAREVSGRLSPYLFNCKPTNLRKTLCDLNNTRRLIAFSAKRNGRQVRAICFDKQSLNRNMTSNFAQIFRLLERDDTSKRNHKTEFDDPLHHCSAAAEAMHHAAARRTFQLFAQDIDRIILGLARVNDHRKICFARH